MILLLLLCLLFFLGLVAWSRKMCRTEKPGPWERRYLRVLAVTGASVLVYFLLTGFRVVNFSYFEEIDNQPLNHPMRVVAAGPDFLTLEDGRQVVFSSGTSPFVRALHDLHPDQSLMDLFKDGAAEVELAKSPGIDEWRYEVFVKKRHWYCGNALGLVPSPLIQLDWFPIPLEMFEKTRLAEGRLWEPRNAISR